MRRAAVVLTALALVTACADDDEPATASSTTTTAPAESTTTESTTTTSEPAAPAIALRGDGLGSVEFGAAPEPAIEVVTAALGEPSVDAGWQPRPEFDSSCPGERIRSVEWGGLVLLFTDGETPHGSGEHLFTWRVTNAPPPLATAEGLGYGATAADAEELYPGMVERVPAEDPFPGFLRIAGEGGEITAYLDEADTITNLEAGSGCGE